MAFQLPEERAGYFSIPGTQRRLFYWYFQARSPSTGAPIANAPLVAWLQGGPGCSSLIGLFFENGPYTINDTLGLVPNPNTWAAAANLIYIDSPVGTGLSYYTSTTSDSSTSQLDVARTLTAFFQAFYRAPRYAALAKSKLILSGESFAGHYIPAAAAYMRANAQSLPLSGIAMGNPLTHGPSMFESYPAYALAQGLISQTLYSRVQESVASCKLLSTLCSTLDPAACKPASKTCAYKVWSATLSGDGSLLKSKNVYNLKQTDCVDPSNCYAQLESRLEQYINANRAKLGAPLNVTYASCSDPPYWSLWGDMTKSYNDLVAALLDSGINVMVYSGDYDFVCNSLGTSKWVDALLWSKQQSWARVKPQAWSGGTFRRLGPLTFVRVAKAGHLVPMDQPAASLLLI
ncbi:hypothetical protein ABPG75_013831 [Micractinium tetrahymenae]